MTDLPGRPPELHQAWTEPDGRRSSAGVWGGLLARPLVAVLTTILPSGRLQSSPVWFTARSGDVVVSTMREFAKARNLRDRPRASLLVVDPDDPFQLGGSAL